MKKYLAVAKILFKAQIVYRFEVAMTALAAIGTVLFAWILWGAAFNGREFIGGYTFQSMLSYYIVSSFISSFDKSNGVSFEVSERIRGGTFSKYMTIPVNPQLHFLSQNLGISAYYALFSVLSAVFCALVFGVKLSISTDPIAIMCSFALMLIGAAFMVCFRFFIGILTFKFQDIGFFIHVQMGLISFLTGSVVPLALLPEGLLRTLNFLPFIHVIYTPVALITGQTDAARGLLGLLILSGWMAVMLVINQKVYNRLRVKFDGVGV